MEETRMKRVLVPVLLVSALAGCNRERADEVQRDQAQERADLAREQEQDRRELAQRQADEMNRARERAAGDLADETQRAQEERGEAMEQTQRLNATIAQACTGIDPMRQDTCPVAAGSVDSVREVDNGIALRLDPSVGDRDAFQRRLDCYKAREAARGLQQPAAPSRPAAAHACLIDFPSSNVDVRESNGRIEVQISTEQRDQLDRLRSEARALAQHAAR
jgi:hypothetical protein